MPKWLWDGLALVGCLAPCVAAWAACRFATRLGVESGWYEGLRQPAWAPAPEVTGQVWIALYGFLAVALWLVWRAQQFSKGIMPYVSFCILLLLQAGGPVLFFVFHDLRGAFLESLMLCLAVLGTMGFFYLAKPRAAALLLPVLAWAVYAAVVQFAFWSLKG